MKIKFQNHWTENCRHFLLRKILISALTMKVLCIKYVIVEITVLFCSKPGRDDRKRFLYDTGMKLLRKGGFEATYRDMALAWFASWVNAYNSHFATNINLHSDMLRKKWKILEKNHTISLQTKNIDSREFSMKFEFQITRTLQLNTLYREKLIRIKLRNFHKRKSLTSTSAFSKALGGTGKSTEDELGIWKETRRTRGTILFCSFSIKINLYL